MSVRRLAADDVQPAAFAFSAENLAWAEKKIAQYPAGRQQSAVIPILWRAQEQEGWVTRAAIEYIAQMLGMAYIRVLEVATFYTQFLLKPVGSEAHIIVCGTTPCMLRGASDLIDVCKHKIAHDPLEISADGKLSWEEAECMGACVNAPMIGIRDDTYEDLTVERFEEIVEAFRSGNGKSIPVGTQIKRQNSGAEGGVTTLLETPTAERTYKAFPPPPPPAPPPQLRQLLLRRQHPPQRPLPSRPIRAGAARQPPNLPRPSRGRRTRRRSPRPRPKASARNPMPRPTPMARRTRRCAKAPPARESPAGKIDGGKAPRKPRAKKTTPPEGSV